MKKILLLAAAALSLNAMAQEGYVNHVVNGDFEDPNYVQAPVEDFTWDPVKGTQDLSELPGWSMSTGGIWNGGVEIFRGDDYMGDGDYRPEEDLAICHLWGYNDNGWTQVAIYQQVKGLVAGRTYNLDYLVALSWPEGSSWTPDPNYGFQIAEVDFNADGALQAGKEIVAKNLNEDPDFQVLTDLQPMPTVEFTAPADGQVYLRIYFLNNYDKGNQTPNLKWMDVDLVKIWSDEEPDAALSDIVVDANAPVEYFNLQGVRIANPESGLYIRRQGNKTTKVVL